MMFGRKERVQVLEPTVAGSEFTVAVEGLMGAVEAGGELLPPEERRMAEAVLTKAATRLAFTGKHTVVALAGATGSGKSTLFNRLVGEELSRPGQLRPTTTSITAAIWGSDPAGELLDWLDVPQRHYIEPMRRGRVEEDMVRDGLVLLDLPDVDSHKEAHRAEADRVLAQTDVFVWVTDPQKYADAILHDEYLAQAKNHQTVTLVVLNQADRMRLVEANACREDLVRLLAADGLPHAPVLLTSARTGLGLEDLAVALAGAARTASASRARLMGDVRREAERLRPFVGDHESELDPSTDTELLQALGRAAGVPIVLATVQKDYLHRSGRHTGWLPTRWLARFRPDPLAAIGLHRKASTSQAGEFSELLARSSLPQATPAARAAVDLATRKVGARAAEGLPRRWAHAVQDAAPDQGGLTDALDQAVVGTPIPHHRPAWWSVMNGVQWLCALAALGGGLWLLALTLSGWLQILLPEVPRVGPFAVPTVMLVAGLLAGFAAALLSRSFAQVGARRRRVKVEQLLQERISVVASERFLAPIRDLLARHRRTRESLDRALGRR
ncbi:MAG: 50S ribosome-binding GTPase [Austwickia sp.]|nr:50S ribosome-binding GTPase [Austwickia sp.]MBK9101492.1 50S ribosome-binding GTPase [Austwickia sp.]